MARYWARMFSERVAGTASNSVWNEPTYKYKGVIKDTTSGVVNKDYILPDVEDGPGLNMQSVNVPWQISSFGSYGGVRLAGSEIMTVGGQFTTALFSENAEWMLRHALVSYKPKNGKMFFAGDTFSFAVARSFLDADNYPQHELYRGCKFSDVSLACSDQSPILRAGFGIVGSTKEYLAGGAAEPYTGDAAKYCTEPTQCDGYPKDVFTFQDMQLFMGDSGTTADIQVTEVRNLALSFRNMLDPIFGQSRNVQTLQRTMCELSWSAEFTMTILGDDATTDLKPPAALNMAPSQWLRYKLESLKDSTTAAAFPIEFRFISNEGGKALKIKIGKSLITSVGDVMPMSRTFSVRVGGIAMLAGDCTNFSIEFDTVTKAVDGSLIFTDENAATTP